MSSSLHVLEADLKKLNKKTYLYEITWKWCLNKLNYMKVKIQNMKFQCRDKSLTVVDIFDLKSV